MSDANNNTKLYSTGELAKLCGVSVRTVQYYDTRNILTPTELSEGGRRMYSEDDLRKMKIICFLRDAGMSLGSIGELFSETAPDDVISILLDQQEKQLQAEIEERQKQLETVVGMRKELKSVAHFSVASIGDIAQVMESRKKMRKLHIFLILTAIPVELMEWTAILLWILSGIWWPFAVYTAVIIPYAVWISLYYFKRVAYICPLCHETFKPRMREAFWANHTPKTRKLTCPHCKHRGFCVEIYDETAKKEKSN